MDRGAELGGMMEDAVFESIAEQMMKGDAVEIGGKRYPVKRSSGQRLKMVTFVVDGEEFRAIEQNPEKPSRWGKLAHDGHKVVQFTHGGRFVAVAVDGKVKRYSR
jgi:hypothetical protein